MSNVQWCEVRLCDRGDGAAVAKHFCKTEGKFVCNQDLEFCNRFAHIWIEVGDEKKPSSSSNSKLDYPANCSV